MQGKDNYPLKKEKSVLDVELELNCEDGSYLKQLDNSLNSILSNFILYQSGVDVLNSDKLGRTALTLYVVKQRDKMVLDFVSGLKIPMVAIGGSYSADVNTIVDAHASLFRQIQLDFF